MKTDEELIKKVVVQQLYRIALLQQYENNPLACPALTPEMRRREDEEWRNVIQRDYIIEYTKK